MSNSLLPAQLCPTIPEDPPATDVKLCWRMHQSQFGSHGAS